MAPPRREYCVSCARRRAPQDFVCPSCGGVFWSDQLDPSLIADRAAALDLRRLAGVLETLPGLPPGDVLLLHGATGSGKSTLALSAFRRPIVVTTEMHPGLILSYAERLNVQVAAVADLVCELDELGAPRLSAALPEHVEADGLIVDSLNGLGHVEAVFEFALRLGAERHLPIVIVAQHTADDKIRGGEHVPHMGHVIAEVRQTEGGGREVNVTKNRFGPVCVLPFVLPGEGAERDYFYVVEGRRGRYQLSAYPWAASPVWDAVEAGILPPIARPAAAAARRSDLYGGWVEPPDWRERERFALSRGVSYYAVGANNGR